MPPEKGTMRWALDAPFRPDSPARTQKCPHCRKRAHHWHHWVPRQNLVRFVRSWAYNEGRTPEEVRRRLTALLKDRRNLTAYCFTEHYRFDGWGWSTHKPTPPDSAYEFARELGEEYVMTLERLYPC